MNTVTMNLKDMIALGKYDWVDPYIPEDQFSIPRDLILGAETKLFHFDLGIYSDDAIAKMVKDGYRPATIFDLLDYGAKNPEEQRKSLIVALGSSVVVDGSRAVVCLGRSWGGSGRCLHLLKLDDVYRKVCCFLGVRK